MPATGEPNASADSEAGVGIYKTTNGGDSWSLVPGSDIFFQRSIGQMALDNAGNLLVPIASGVRGISSVSGGSISSGSDRPSARDARTVAADRERLSRSSGRRRSRSRIDDRQRRSDARRRHLRERVPAGHLALDEQRRDVLADFRGEGSRAERCIAIDRSEFDITTLSNGATRMYVGEGQGGGAGHLSNFWRSDNADTTATFVAWAAHRCEDYCTTQCWYDNVVYTPAGFPDVVYLLGSFSYGQLGGVSNGRARAVVDRRRQRAGAT